MARPTRFDPKLARLMVAHVALGRTNAFAAEAAGVSPRTLQGWLSRGRRGEAPFADFAARFGDASESVRRARVAAHYEREAAKGKLRRKAFRAAQREWCLENLGPVAFWARRVAWCRERGLIRGEARAMLELAAAVDAEGDCRAAARVIA